MAARVAHTRDIAVEFELDGERERITFTAFGLSDDEPIPTTYPDEAHAAFDELMQSFDELRADFERTCDDLAGARAEIDELKARLGETKNETQP